MNASTPTPATPLERNLPARVLVVAAMQEEAAAIEARGSHAHDCEHPFAGSDRVRVRELDIQAADSSTVPVRLVTTGIGTASAAAVVAAMLQHERPCLVVNVGSCGGLAADINVGDVVVGESFAYSIADATAFGYAIGQVPGAPERFITPSSLNTRAASEAIREHGLSVRSGLMISGDAFVTQPLADAMRERFPGVLSADMESAAVAHISHLAAVPYVAIRSVSDLCSPRAGEEFHIGLDVAAEHSARALAAALPVLLAGLTTPATPPQA